MAGKYGVETAKKVAVDVAKIVNVASKAVHGSALALFDLFPVAMDLKGVDFVAFKAEVLELDPTERAQVEAAFKGALDLVNKDVQAKLQEGVDCLDKGVELVEEAVALVLKVKALVGA